MEKEIENKEEMKETEVVRTVSKKLKIAAGILAGSIVFCVGYFNGKDAKFEEITTENLENNKKIVSEEESALSALKTELDDLKALINESETKEVKEEKKASSSKTKTQIPVVTNKTQSSNVTNKAQNTTVETKTQTPTTETTTKVEQVKDKYTYEQSKQSFLKIRGILINDAIDKSSKGLTSYAKQLEAITDLINHGKVTNVEMVKLLNSYSDPIINDMIVNGIQNQQYLLDLKGNKNLGTDFIYAVTYKNRVNIGEVTKNETGETVKVIQNINELNNLIAKSKKELEEEYSKRANSSNTKITPPGLLFTEDKKVVSTNTTIVHLMPEEFTKSSLYNNTNIKLYKDTMNSVFEKYLVEYATKLAREKYRNQGIYMTEREFANLHIPKEIKENKKAKEAYINEAEKHIFFTREEKRIFDRNFDGSPQDHNTYSDRNGEVVKDKVDYIEEKTETVERRVTETEIKEEKKNEINVEYKDGKFYNTETGEEVKTVSYIKSNQIQKLLEARMLLTSLKEEQNQYVQVGNYKFEQQLANSIIKSEQKVKSMRA